MFKSFYEIIKDIKLSLSNSGMGKLLIYVGIRVFEHFVKKITCICEQFVTSNIINRHKGLCSL